MPLRVRRGTNAERQTITPLEGELIYTIDTKQVYIGDGNTVGGISLVSSTGGYLGDDLTLNGNNIDGVGNIQIIGTIGNESIYLTGNKLTHISPFTENGHTMGVLQLGGTSLNNVEPHLQLLRNWENNKSPFEKNYSISNTFDAASIEYNASRGTISVPTTLQSGDWIFSNKFLGHDGNDHFVSSVVSYSVDNNASILPGIIPGKITFSTASSLGNLNNLVFDSKGFLGVNKTNPSAALDVIGNGKFTGTVSAAAFNGSLISNDSVLAFDDATGNFNGNTINGTVLNISDITIEGKYINSNNTYVSNGHLLGTIQFGGSVSDPLEPHCQIIRNWEDIFSPIEKIYGISNGYGCIYEDKYAVRNTIASPASLQPGDFLFSSRYLGFDGTDYATACGISCSVDSAGTIAPGKVPGKIIFTTTNNTVDFNILSFDSRGYLGVNTFIVTEALDVVGNGKFTGTVTGAAFVGSLLGNDSLLAFDDATGNITGNNITGSSINTSEISIVDNFIYPKNPFASNGHLLGTIQFGGSPSDPLEPHCQIIRKWEEVFSPIEKIYGVSNGFSSIYEDRYAARNSTATPASLQPGDFLFNTRFLGHDGNDYATVCGISCSVDETGTIEPGLIPGKISFTTTSDTTGFINVLSFDSRGYLGVNTFIVTEALDVVGNGKFTGTVTGAAFVGSLLGNDSLLAFDDATGNFNGNQITAAAFKGTFVADDSTIIVDGVNGNVTGNTVTSNGFVMFGSYDATARSNLTAANGMVIYNTTANRFQGFQNGAWINLDDGTAAP